MADPPINPTASWDLQPICPPDFFERLQESQHQPEDYNHLIARTINEICNFVSGSGGFIQKDGVLYYVDTLRNKVLSTNRTTPIGSYCGQNQKNRYMKFGDVVGKGNTGFLCPRAATITALWAKSRSTGSWTIEARRNDSPITLVSVGVTAGKGSNMVLDFDLNAGDYVQLFINGTGIDQPIASIELAWRATT